MLIYQFVNNEFSHFFNSLVQYNHDLYEMRTHSHDMPICIPGLPLVFVLLYDIMFFITMTSQWRLKSPASRVFTQPFIQAQIKKIIKVPRHWPLQGEFTGDRRIPRTKGQLRGKCFHLLTSSCDIEFPTPGSARLMFTLIRLIHIRLRAVPESEIYFSVTYDNCRISVICRFHVEIYTFCI